MKISGNPATNPKKKKTPNTFQEKYFLQAHAFFVFSLYPTCFHYKKRFFFPLFFFSPSPLSPLPPFSFIFCEKQKKKKRTKMSLRIAEETCTAADLIPRISGLLQRLCTENIALMQEGTAKETVFDCKQVPSIPIQSYLVRLVSQGRFSASTLILMVVYVDRLFKRCDVQFTFRNIHRIVLTALVVATKTYSDAYYNNSHYARVGGIALADMNNLEVAFLGYLSWELQAESEYYSYRSHLQQCPVVQKAAEGKGVAAVGSAAAAVVAKKVGGQVHDAHPPAEANVITNPRHIVHTVQKEACRALLPKIEMRRMNRPSGSAVQVM